MMKIHHNQHSPPEFDIAIMSLADGRGTRTSDRPFLFDGGQQDLVRAFHGVKV
jgi:hypothetical protein